MGISLDLVNFDELFYKRNANSPVIINQLTVKKKKETSKGKPVVVNHVIEDSESDKEKLNRLLYTKYSNSTDLLSNIPTCECGKITGGFNVGVTCADCNTVVVSPLHQELEPLIWIQAPEGVRALMNPNMWIMLTKVFTRSNFNIIRWICDTTYESTVKTPPVVEYLINRGIVRGYNNFVDNFDSIMDILFEIKIFKKKQNLDLKRLIIEKRDCIFSQYLPILNRSLLVIEQSNNETYVDVLIPTLIDAVRKMVSIDSSLSTFTVRVKENRTVKTIAQLADFYKACYKSTLAGKPGALRKHVYGSRAHWSFRAVVSSITNPHDHEQIHISWGIGINVLKVHLSNKLLKLGYTPNQIIDFLNEHNGKYHPLLEQLFEELINETPNGRGIPALLQRNLIDVITNIMGYFYQKW